MKLCIINRLNFTQQLKNLQIAKSGQEGIGFISLQLDLKLDFVIKSPVN